MTIRWRTTPSAEIPGTDKKDEIVMLGGHLDSWHAGTGATDNAARRRGRDGGGAHPEGAGVKPRRTIRIGAVERRGGGLARLEGLRGAAHRRTPAPANGPSVAAAVLHAA